MGSIQGGTRRTPRRCREGVATFDTAAKSAFRASDDRLGAAWRRTSALLQHAQAQSRDKEDSAVRHIVVTVNKSRTLRIEKPFASAVVGSPDIVDALPMSDRTLYIQGKKVGTTNVSVFDQTMQLIGVIDVEVTLDTGNLQDKIRASTGSSGIRVGSSNGQIVLSGVAGNAVAAERAVQVAKSMVAEGGTIVNAMTVAPAQQVMLKVRFLEVERSASREFGVNWFGANNGGNRGFATGIGGVTQPGGRPAITGVDASGNPVPAPGSPAGSGALGLPIFGLLPAHCSPAHTPFGVALANLASKGATLDVLLTALETKGLVRRLAEPDLIALSGDTASFLAGGEYPVPVAQPGAYRWRAGHYRPVPAVRRAIDFHSDSPGKRHHQSAPRALGERAQLCASRERYTASTSHRSTSARRAPRSSCVTARASQSPACCRRTIGATSRSFPGLARCRSLARCSAASHS